MKVVSLALAAALLASVAVSAGATPRINSHAALDCHYCHYDTPRFGVDTRDTVNFWRAEGDEPRLCERCHGPEANFHPLGVTPDPKSLGTLLPLHLPLGKSWSVRDKVVCTTCHFVHAANADWALLRGFPGSSDPGRFSTWQDLCRQCHGEGLKKRSPHAGDERSCSFCHASRPQPGQPAVVTPAGRKLCEFCHGFKPAGHYADANPFKEPQDCTRCHDPHLGKDHPARLKAGYLEPLRDEITLNPHRKRTFCFACHADGRSGPLRGADAGALCQRCHGSGKIPAMSHPMTKVPAGYPIPSGWPLPGGSLTCLTCHFPGHVSGAVAGRPDEPPDAWRLLRGADAGDRSAVCFLCHARSQWAGRNPHREAARGKAGCSPCHAKQPVWGQDRSSTVSFVASINIVCLACHSDIDHPGNTSHTVKLTDAMPAVPEILPLDTGRRITCATCHDPHLDAPDGHRLRGTKKSSAFCLHCHNL